MAVFELVITLLLVGAVLAALARRLNAPYPALLALAGRGAGAAAEPARASRSIRELALTLLVAPVLLDAAFDSSPRDLRRNWRAVTGLALVAVGLTVVAVAVVARWLVPGIPWPAAIALGAIVAPPDAAAATAVLHQLRPPHRILVILEGESLFNDASALLIYRLAVAAAITGSFAGWSAVPMLAAGRGGQRGARACWPRGSRSTSRRASPTSPPPSSSSSSPPSRSGCWPSRLHLSGIITVVVFAILRGARGPDLISARLRIQSYAVWEVVVFVLNVLAFILIGLQLKPILARLSGPELAPVRHGGHRGLRDGHPGPDRVGDELHGCRPLGRRRR